MTVTIRADQLAAEVLRSLEQGEDLEISRPDGAPLHYRQAEGGSDSARDARDAAWQRTVARMQKPKAEGLSRFDRAALYDDHLTGEQSRHRG